MSKTKGDENIEIKGNEFARCYKLMNRKWLLVITFFFTICQGVSPLLMNVIMAQMMNVMTSSVTDDFLNKIKNLCLQLLYIIIAMVAINSLSLGFRMVVTACYCTDIREKMFDSLMEQSISFYDEFSPGVLIGSISEDVTFIKNVYIDKFLQVISNMVQALAGIILSFCYAWRIALAIFPAYPLSGIIYLLFNFFLNKLWEKYNNSLIECIDKAEEAISQVRIVKSFDCELREAQIYSQNIMNIKQIVQKQAIIGGIKNGIIAFISWGTTAFLLYYTYWIVVNKPYLGVEIGDVMILMMSVMLGSMGISLALSFVDDFKKASISAAKILKIIDQKPEVDRHKGLNLINGKDHAVGKIEFRNVSFRYKTRESYAIENLSFIINPGETVALVGESGCGKSTTLQLLQRFYEIKKGKILIDDVDIKDLSQIFLRSQISSVPQGPVLFSVSIRDNIRYAKPDANDHEVYDAARIGNAHNFIMELPQDYDTIVHQASLSGGQKQRICISRAILRNSPILLLDEATAALDTESEQLVQQSIESIRHGKTCIIVAHRLATVMNADRILVFKDGNIHESGTHLDLMKKNGIYANLVKYQLE
ncbi:hypothetical protein M9Y10_019552 [Tritrichomonas musculus]|uniref:ABC transporter family protein n=1 Tax=Tritrichomonas musculus TaxID=1915356 RepID=A0ABR2HHM7_9EUKA